VSISRLSIASALTISASKADPQSLLSLIFIS
jgi:hypothetical protein